jgi:thioredoxin 1
MSSAVLELTDATFDEGVSVSDVPVLVEFWAAWCPPCRVMAPVLDEVARDAGDQLRVLNVDADAYPELARRYEVASVPTLLVFTDGELRHRMVGARSQSRLLEEIGQVTNSLSR